MPLAFCCKSFYRNLKTLLVKHQHSHSNSSTISSVQATEKQPNTSRKILPTACWSYGEWHYIYFCLFKKYKCYVTNVVKREVFVTSQKPNFKLNSKACLEFVLEKKKSQKRLTKNAQTQILCLQFSKLTSNPAENILPFLSTRTQSVFNLTQLQILL